MVLAVLVFALFLGGLATAGVPGSGNLNSYRQLREEAKMPLSLGGSQPSFAYSRIATSFTGLEIPEVSHAPSNGSLVVVVIDALTNLVIPGARVVSYYAPINQTQLDGLTNSSGLVSFLNIAVGVYSIGVNASLHFNEISIVDVYAGQTFTLNFALTSTRVGDLDIRVVDSDSGQSVVGATVFSIHHPNHQLALNGATDSLGFAIFKQILVGNYTFVIIIGGYSDTQVEAYISANSTTIEVVYLTKQPFWLLPVNLAVIIGVSSAVILLSIMVMRRRAGRPRSVAVDPDSMLPQRYGEVPNTAINLPVDREKRATRPTLGACPYCGSSIRIDGASFCKNCGGRLTATNVVLNKGQLKRPVPQGHCMVCSLPLKPGDTLVWCPYCGNASHKTHMLEWLHVKDHCPVCHRQLDPDDLKH
ncbi:MAG: zinc ribbon domain-containing protein [Promethearchaeati archaeon SRVP18_Atabeyarchaeia-1]